MPTDRRNVLTKAAAEQAKADYSRRTTVAVKEKPASSDEVREWANATGWRDNYDRPVSDRGRLPSSLIEAFNSDRDHKRRGIVYNPVARGMSQPPRSDSDNRGRGGNSRTESRSTSAPRGRSQDTTAPAPRQRRSAARDSDQTPDVIVPANAADLMAALAAAGGGATLHATYRLEFDTANA